jgi:hypothetical protein
LADAGDSRQSSQITGLNLMALVGKEREYPFDPPDLEELMRWFGCSMAVLLMAAVGAGLMLATTHTCRPERAAGASRVAFWSAALVLGLFATPVINRFSTEFVFTWPVALFAVHQTTLTVVVWARRQPEDVGRRWASAVAVGALLGSCLLYFLISRRLGLAVTWVFLVGLTPSWLVAVPAAYWLSRPVRLWSDLLYATVSFSAYFWISGAISVARETWGLGIR